MDFNRALRKFGLPLVALCAALLWYTDGERFRWPSPSETPVETAPVQENNHAAHSEDHDHAGEADPHADPEKNRRMGIFHFNEGNKFMQQGEVEAAVSNYKMALHHNKEFPQARINLSTAYLQAQKYDKALETLAALQKFDPEHPVGHYNLACYYSLTGQPGPSLDALKQAVKFGYSRWNQIETDPDLENLRKDPAFVEWMRTEAARLRQKTAGSG